MNTNNEIISGINEVGVARANEMLVWLTTLTPDKLAVLLAFILGYIIVRVRFINTNWCWLACPLLAAGVYAGLGQGNVGDYTHARSVIFRILTGLVLGSIAALAALSLHNHAFKALVKRYPALSFLILCDDLNSPPTAQSEVELQTKEQSKP